MTRVDSFNKRQGLLKEHFENYMFDHKKPEHTAVCELFRLYDKLMSWYYTEDMTKDEFEKWTEQMNLAGIKAHHIYINLKMKGIVITYDSHLIENRIEYCNCGPDQLQFHLHQSSIESLLNFCIVGTAINKELRKMRKALGIKP